MTGGILIHAVDAAWMSQETTHVVDAAIRCSVALDRRS